MDDEIRVNRVRPYPANSNEGRRKRPPAGEEPPEDEPGAPAEAEDETEVEEGHIDTRAAPEPAAHDFY